MPGVNGLLVKLPRATDHVFDEYVTATAPGQAFVVTHNAVLENERAVADMADAAEAHEILEHQRVGAITDHEGVIAVELGLAADDALDARGDGELTESYEAGGEGPAGLGDEDRFGPTIYGGVDGSLQRLAIVLRRALPLETVVDGGAELGDGYPSWPRLRRVGPVFPGSVN